MEVEKQHKMIALDPTKESIKIMRNTRGNYTWEIKIHPLDDKLEEHDIKRLETINDWLDAKWGGE